MILTGRYNHLALIKCGAAFNRDEPDGNTYVLPDGLDTTAYNTHLTAVNKQSLKDNVSAKRYAVETAGINFTYRTVPTPVSTSRETRASMIGAHTKAKEGRWVEAPATEKPFKFGDGKFRPVTTQEVIDIYRAVESHVDTCYAVEARKLAEIDATGTTDINTGWPT